MKTQTEISGHTRNINHTLNIQIGSVCCAVRCLDDGIYQRLKGLYQGFLTDQPVDICFELEATDNLSPSDLDKALSEAKYVHDVQQRFWSSNKIVSGEYDLNKGFVYIRAERSLGDPDSEFNYLNRLMSLAYYSACKRKYHTDYPAILLHSCGIVRNGKAILFVGPSEEGKTTIARLTGDKHGVLLNDEIILVNRSMKKGDAITVQSAPFIGGFLPQGRLEAPLRVILLLKKSKRTALNHLNKSQAYLRLMRQVINPAYIGQREKRQVYSMMSDFSAEMVEQVPVYELEFNLDEEALWSNVSDIEAIS